MADAAAWAARRANKGAEWKDGRPCADHPEEFFADSNREQKLATQVCQLECPIQSQCLLYALEADERYGVWGGTTERERERLRKKQRAAAS